MNILGERESQLREVSTVQLTIEQGISIYLQELIALFVHSLSMWFFSTQDSKKSSPIGS